jgi:hypothetical protein
LFLLTGTAINPYVIQVDGNLLESHFGFTVLKVEGNSTNDKIRTIYEVKKTVPLQDINQWFLSIPTSDDLVPFAHDPSIADRVVLAKGPAMDHYQMEIERINDKMYRQTQETCTMTQNTRRAAANEVETSSFRHVAHYVFVFPQGERLDNAAFSANKFLDKSIIAIRDLQSTFTPNNDNLYGMLFISRIALHGGRHIDQRVATINTSQCNWDD